MNAKNGAANSAVSCVRHEIVNPLVESRAEPRRLPRIHHVKALCTLNSTALDSPAGQALPANDADRYPKKLLKKLANRQTFHVNINHNT